MSFEVLASMKIRSKNCCLSAAVYTDYASAATLLDVPSIAVLRTRRTDKLRSLHCHCIAVLHKATRPRTDAAKAIAK